MNVMIVSYPGAVVPLRLSQKKYDDLSSFFIYYYYNTGNVISKLVGFSSLGSINLQLPIISFYI